MSPVLHRIARPPSGELPEDAEAFLRWLPGPTAIEVAGRDRSRSRVAVTLLHGNEPSGLRAMHAWLRRDLTPAVDALLVVANAEAALLAPAFSHRSVPERRDLNRCFREPFDDAEGRLAHAILGAIRDTAPEALIDLHNNTGHNPPYGVGIDPSPEVLQLVAPFGDRFVWSHLVLGALMEAVTEFPSATIEVGRAGDTHADEVARVGLANFLEAERVITPGAETTVQILTMPMRVRLRPGVSLEVADRISSADLTILADLDRHNFERVAAGTLLGYARGDDWPLELIDEHGRDRARDYFSLDGGTLRTRQAIVPIMITTDPAIAASDCLFYVVRES